MRTSPVNRSDGGDDETRTQGLLGGWKRYGVGGGVAHDKVVEGENVLLVGGVLVGPLVVDVGEEDVSVHVLVKCERV